MDNCEVCANCNQQTKPKISGNATGVVCQNPDCRMIYDRNGNMEGQMLIAKFNKGGYPEDDKFKEEKT